MVFFTEGNTVSTKTNYELRRNFTIQQFIICLFFFKLIMNESVKETMKESENIICTDYIVALGVKLEMLSSSSFSLVIHWLENPVLCIKNTTQIRN